jgi:hypothetical protein
MAVKTILRRICATVPQADIRGKKRLDNMKTVLSAERYGAMCTFTM